MDALKFREAEDGFLYHYTDGSNLPGISRTGLRAPVYASTEAAPSIVMGLFQDSDITGISIIRFRRSGEWRIDIEFYDDRFLKSDTPVSADEIEVRTPFGWRRIR